MSQPEQNSLQFKTYDKFLTKKNNLKTIESRKSLYCARWEKIKRIQVNKVVSEKYLMGSIHLSVEANLLTIFIDAETPRLSKVNTYFKKKVRIHDYSKKRNCSQKKIKSLQICMLTSSKLSYNH